MWSLGFPMKTRPQSHKHFTRPFWASVTKTNKIKEYEASPIGSFFFSKTFKSQPLVVVHWYTHTHASSVICHYQIIAKIKLAQNFVSLILRIASKKNYKIKYLWRKKKFTHVHNERLFRSCSNFFIFTKRLNNSVIWIYLYETNMIIIITTILLTSLFTMPFFYKKQNKYENITKDKHTFTTLNNSQQVLSW